MLETSDQKRPVKERCQGCELPLRFCLCQKLTPLETKSHISIIMHHREERLASNTGRLAKLSMPKCQIFLRGELNSALEMEQVLNRPGKAVFLYPSEDAVDVADLATEEGPYHLIVPDGSWRQAKRVKKREPLLQNIPSVCIKPTAPARYLLRRPPRPEFISTFEAIAWCMKILEGEETYQRLMEYFDLLIQPQFDIRHPDQKREALARLKQE